MCRKSRDFDNFRPCESYSQSICIPNENVYTGNIAVCFTFHRISQKFLLLPVITQTILEKMRIGFHVCQYQ